MKKNRKPLIVGNWKTNPATFEEAKMRFQAIKRGASKHNGIEVVICPPSPYISALRALSKNTNVTIGAQDVSIYSEGSKTGEVSASMIYTSGAQIVIVGHSERRVLGDTDGIVASKVAQALKTEMTIVICIGEAERDNEGEYLHVIKRQLKEALAPVSRSQFGQIIIAYEPVWAIGRKDNVAITSHDLHQMVIFIKKYIKEVWGDTIASVVPILYGGSVTAENAQDILWNGEVDGLLVGRASWQADTFGALFTAVDTRRKATIQLNRNKFSKAKKIKQIKKVQPVKNTKRAKPVKKVSKKSRHR